MWSVVWLVVALVAANSLPSNRLASKNAISACESNYYCVNIIISIENIIISDVLSNDLCSISQKPTSILHCNSGILLTSFEVTRGIKLIKIKEMNFRVRTTLSTIVKHGSASPCRDERKTRW